MFYEDDFLPDSKKLSFLKPADVVMMPFLGKEVVNIFTHEERRRTKSWFRTKVLGNFNDFKIVTITGIK